MPVPTIVLASAKASVFLLPAGWSVQLYRSQIQRRIDQEQYDLETKKCPTIEQLRAMRATKACGDSKNEAA